MLFYLCYYIIHHSVSSDGNITQSEVKTFLKRQHALTETYKSITTSGNMTVDLPGNHLIFARTSSSKKFSAM